MKWVSEQPSWYWISWSDARTFGGTKVERPRRAMKLIVNLGEDILVKFSDESQVRRASIPR